MGIRMLMDVRSRSRLRRRLREFWKGLRGESGGALVELALTIGFLGVPMLLGTAEMGILVYDSIEIADAANAGAWYGMRSSTFAADSAGIQTAAQAEASDFTTSLSVTSTTFYVCATAVAGTRYTGGTAQSDATAACTGAGNHVLQFVQVSTSASVSPSMVCPGLPKTFTLRGNSVMEVEQ